MQAKDLMQKGFSLIELMVVMSIMTALTSIAMPKFYTMKIRAARSEAFMNMKTIYTLAHAYNAENSINPADFSYGYNILAGGTQCNTPNEIGFRANDCFSLRYGYTFYRDGARGNTYDASGRTFFTVEAMQIRLKFSDSGNSIWDAQTGKGPIVGICRAGSSTGVDEFFLDWWTMYDNGATQPAFNDPANNAEINCLAGINYDFLP